MTTTNQPATPTDRLVIPTDGLLTRLNNWFRGEERKLRRAPKPHDGWLS